MALVKGSFAVPVIRFLVEEANAKDLAERGRARFTRLDLYRKAEDARGDDSEGLGRIAKGKIAFVVQDRVPVEATLESEATNPIYILSFSEVSADLPSLARRFSSTYGVEFSDPEQLNSAMPNTTIDPTPNECKVVSIRIAQVRYDKDLPREQLSMSDALDTAFTQKPARFECEKEWRLAVILAGQRAVAPEHVFGTIPITRPATVRHFEFA